MDFTGLSDDQLIELLRLALAEAVERGAATAAAAQNIGLDASEELRVKQAAAAAEAARQAARAQAEAKAAAKREAEAKRQAKLWANKADLGQMVRDALGPGYQITVWQNQGETEKRVYIDRQGYSRDGSGVTKVSYFVTGNSRNPPGDLDVDCPSVLPRNLSEAGEARWHALSEPAGRDKLLRPIGEKAAADWHYVKFDCDQAVEFAERAKRKESENV